MDIETLLVLHASPTLANMKASSLICPKGLTEENTAIKEGLGKKGLSFHIFTNRKGCKLLFVYREKKLKETLSSPTAMRILEENG